MSSDPEELGARLRSHATRTSAGTGLAAGSLRRARAIQRRRTMIAAVAALAIIAGGVGGAGALGLFGGQPDDLPVAGPPVTSTEPAPSLTRPASDSPTPTPDLQNTTQDSGPPDTPPTATPPATTPPPNSGSPSDTPRRVDLCSLDNSEVRIDIGQGAAGHVEYFIVVTNASDQACTIHGFPGVSIESTSGGQLGAAAIYDRSVDDPAITVAPGESAKASLWLAQADAYGDECRAEPGAGFRIYPPEELDWVVIRMEVTGCANDDIALMQVRPFQPA